MRALMNVLTDLGPKLLLDPRTGKDVLGGYGGSLPNGGTVRSPMPGISGGGYGVLLDGVDDYVSTTLKTRRNLVTTPRFDTPAGLGNWATGGTYTGTGSTLTNPTIAAVYGAYGSKVLQVATTGTALQGAYTSLGTLQGGRTYYVYLRVGSNVGGSTVRAGIGQVSAPYASKDIVASMAAGTPFTTYTIAFTPAVTDTYQLWVRAENAVATTFLVDLAMVTPRVGGLSSAVRGAWTPLMDAYPDPATGTLKEAVGYTGSLQNGATVDSTALITNEPGALVLDGVNDYGSIALPTRRNLCPYPSHEVTLGTAGYGGATAVRSTDYAKYGTYSAKITTPGVTVAGGAEGSNQTAPTLCAAVTPNTQYTVSMWVRAPLGATLQMFASEYTSPSTYVGGAQTNFTGTGDWQRVSVTSTVGGSTTLLSAAVRTRATAQAITWYEDATLIEQASSAGAYFDGSGYVDGSGNWQSSNGVWTGWLGTANASASDFGPFANGTTRTIVGVAQVAADAASGVGQALFGSNLSGGSGGTYGRLYNNAGTRTFWLSMGTSNYLWNLTASEITATAAGQTFAYRLEINETADTAKLTIAKWDGTVLPTVTKTGVTAQHGAGQTAVQLGIYFSSASPFPGKIGRTSILAGTISDQSFSDYAFTLSQVLADTAAVPYGDGDGNQDDAGVWQSGTGGWTGTVGQSVSEWGAFPNGSVRTLVVVGRRSSTAYVGLLSSSNVGAYIARMYLGAEPSPNVLYFEALNGVTVCSWNLPNSTYETFVLAVEFAEASDSVSAYMNGAPLGAQALTDQYNGPNSTVEIGRLGGSFPFGGLLGPVAIFYRSLSAQDHKAIAKTALAGRFG